MLNIVQDDENWTDALTGIAAAIGSLPCSSIVLDGEAVVMLPDGRQDFHALRGRDGCRMAQLVAYDVLHLDGEDLRRLPLDRRREILRGVLDGAGSHLVFSEALDEDGPAVFRAACGLGLEGIVSKRRDAPYRSGRSASWVKSKSSTYRRGD